MSQQSIGQGPGNLVPDSEYKMFLCAAAVTKGWAVGLSGAVAVAARVAAGAADHRVGLSVEGADTDVADANHVIGVAMETGAQDTWIKVCTGGYCDYIVTDGSVAEGDHLIPTASPGVCGGTAGTTRDLEGFGIALDADASTLLVGGAIIESKY
jgi:hypothetical protein